MTVGAHQPRRPEWSCRSCGCPYPCQAERDRLIAAHGLSRKLGELAYTMLEQAVRELPDVPVAELWDRFVAWTEPVRSELPLRWSELVRTRPELPVGRYR